MHVQNTGCSLRITEAFWVDLAIDNPLDVEISISNLTVLTREAKAQDPASIPDFVETEIVDEINLGAHETRTVSMLSLAVMSCSLPSRSPSQSNAQNLHPLLSPT